MRAVKTDTTRLSPANTYTVTPTQAGGHPAAWREAINFKQYARDPVDPGLRRADD